MTKIKGNAILVHIQNISAASELHQYVLKVLKVRYLFFCNVMSTTVSE